VVPKKQKPTSGLTSIVESRGKYSLPPAMTVSGHLSAESYSRAKPESLIEDIISTKISTFSRQKESTLFVVTKQTPQKHAWKRSL
jgi:hypothetical protein